MTAKFSDRMLVDVSQSCCAYGTRFCANQHEGVRLNLMNGEIDLLFFLVIVLNILIIKMLNLQIF